MSAGRFVLYALLVSALLGAGFVALIFRAQRALMFPAPSARGPEPDLSARGAERAWLEAGEARVEAWLLPARSAAGRGSGPLLVFGHGNGELIDHWLDAFDDPRSWGASVLLVEYPGYGRSRGIPSQVSITKTMVAAYDWALTRPGVDPARVVGWGRSLGGGAVCALAQQRPLAALVLESSFTSVTRLAGALGLPGFLVRDPFDNLGAVRAFAGPVLIVHGERDDLIPVAHARELHAAIPGSRIFLEPDCGHNDCPRPFGVLREFLLENDLLTR